MATELERCHGSWKRCPAGVQQEPGCQAKEKVQGGRAQGINSLSLLWGEEVLALGDSWAPPVSLGTYVLICSLATWMALPAMLSLALVRGAEVDNEKIELGEERWAQLQQLLCGHLCRLIQMSEQREFHRQTQSGWRHWQCIAHRDDRNRL